VGDILRDEAEAICRGYIAGAYTAMGGRGMKRCSKYSTGTAKIAKTAESKVEPTACRTT
jgi:hypothetical protein